MKASDAKKDPPVPAEARRKILLAAVEEEAVLDVLRLLKEEFGQADEHWLAAIRQEAILGNLEIYRYPADAPGFDAVDATTLSRSQIGTDYGDAAYMARTASTLSVISTLPRRVSGASS